MLNIGDRAYVDPILSLSPSLSIYIYIYIYIYRERERERVVSNVGDYSRG